MTPIVNSDRIFMLNLLTRWSCQPWNALWRSSLLTPLPGLGCRTNWGTVKELFSHLVAASDGKWPEGVILFSHPHTNLQFPPERASLPRLLRSIINTFLEKTKWRPFIEKIYIMRIYSMDEMLRSWNLTPVRKNRIYFFYQPTRVCLPSVPCLFRGDTLIRRICLVKEWRRSILS